MQIVFHKKFKKAFLKLPPKVQRRFGAQLEIFCQDPYDPTLNNHALTGTLQAYRSINITGDIRAWYEVVGEEVVFLKIGSHSELYR
jgi:addiction module RelE/StbE family toxin